MTSKVQIANLALAKLGSGTITSFTDDNDEARAVNLFYEPTLRAELRRHTWACAKDREILAPNSEEPAFEYDYAFDLPVNFLRLLKDAREPHDWVIEGRQLLTNEGDTLELPFIKYLEDPNDMDPLFVEAFACRLAVQMCPRLIQSRTKKADMAEEYRDALNEAKKAGAMEKEPVEPYTDDWILAML